QLPGSGQKIAPFIQPARGKPNGPGGELVGQIDLAQSTASIFAISSIMEKCRCIVTLPGGDRGSIDAKDH
ncbi:MAG TPA: hypothetical protein VIJ35_15105, partial [Bradyrhizobium sp.]